MELGKIGKYYTNYSRDNHNVNICRVKKKEESIGATTKATIHNHNVKRHIICMSYMWFEWTQDGRLSLV